LLFLREEPYSKYCEISLWEWQGGSYMLEETLQSISARLQISPNQVLNARDTERAFVTPILQAIGWNQTNLSDVIVGYSGVDQGSVVTYALCDGQPMLLVDVLPLYSALSQTRKTNKVVTTFKGSPAEYLALANGANWAVYNKQMELILYINVRSKEAKEQLLLLQKSALRDGLLKEYAAQNKIDKNDVFGKQELKARGYKLSEHTHVKLAHLKKIITANRELKTQDISVSLIIEAVLEEFIDRLDHFNYKEIPNETVLKKRVKEVFS